MARQDIVTMKKKTSGSLGQILATLLQQHNKRRGKHSDVVLTRNTWRTEMEAKTAIASCTNWKHMTHGNGWIHVRK